MSESGVPSQLADRYPVLRVLGRGAFGAVYLAADTELKRQVAIKVLLPEAADNEMLQRFQREAKVTARLRHPHVVGVYDFGTADGRPYLVYEFVEGHSLQNRIARGAAALGPRSELFDWCIQGAEGLAAAHRIGVVHRDIKPANVMVRASDRSLVICDFGLAFDAEAMTQLTATSSVGMGTPMYIAREALLGEPVTPASDQFAWGLVIYEIFQRQSLRVSGSEIFARLAGIAARPIREFSPEMMPTDPLLAAILERALAPLPEDRFSDMRGLITALEERRAEGAAEDSATEPVPAGPGSRPASWSGAAVSYSSPSGAAELHLESSLSEDGLGPTLADAPGGRGPVRRGGSFRRWGLLWIAVVGLGAGYLRGTRKEPVPSVASGTRPVPVISNGALRRATLKIMGPFGRWSEEGTLEVFDPADFPAEEAWVLDSAYPARLRRFFGELVERVALPIQSTEARLFEGLGRRLIPFQLEALGRVEHRLEKSLVGGTGQRSLEDIRRQRKEVSEAVAEAVQRLAVVPGAWPLALRVSLASHGRVQRDRLGMLETLRGHQQAAQPPEICAALGWARLALVMRGDPHSISCRIRSQALEEYRRSPCVRDGAVVSRWVSAEARLLSDLCSEP